MAALLEKFPRAGYGHCNISEIDANGNRKRTRRLRPRPTYEEPDVSLRRSASGYRVAANIVIYRSDALRAANYYRQGWKFGEDWDLSIRLADLGWGNVFSPLVLGSYRVWNDAQNVRAKRRITQISRVLAIYYETLEPIYRARQWELARLRHLRRKHAKEAVGVLSSTLFSRAEKSEILRLLKLLGDSPGLRRRILFEKPGPRRHFHG